MVTRFVAAVFAGFILCCAPVGAACAQESREPAVPAAAQPLEITADDTLEWRRNDRQYVARGNASAKQGDVTIAADMLRADYRETASSSSDIYKLTAEGTVRIISQGNTAEGDRAEYDVDARKAVMTGKSLRLTSPEQVVTARDRFEYDVAGGRLSAVGAARAVQGDDRIDAAILSAVFAADTKTGKRTLKRLEAEGGVTITTPAEILTGDHGDYDSATNVARLTGHVRIVRGPNTLEGESAEVNLTTNVSTMRGNSAAGGRVRGVFYPDSMPKTGAAQDAGKQEPVNQGPGGAFLSAP